ncbi:hypothetical protein ACWAT4_31065 [Bradyrhizobium manausense]
MANPCDKIGIKQAAMAGSGKIWALLTQKDAIVVRWPRTVDRMSGRGDTDEPARELFLMAKAIELIVEHCVQSEDCDALEDLRMQRQQLVRDLEPEDEPDHMSTVRQIEREIAAIEAGLMRLGRRTNDG